MRLYGKNWSRREILARVGRLEQLGGIFRRHCLDGFEDGCEVLTLRTGAGLEADILPSRGFDLGQASFHGVPLTWQGVNGYADPRFYQPRGTVFLRTFAGGMLATCGLTAAGSADPGEGDRPLHGTAHHTPSREVCAEGWWDGDEYELRARGVVEERSLFGHHLRLTREIRARVGENRLRLSDRVENLGFAPAPNMMIYHCNFGFPLIAERTIARVPGRSLTPREDSLPRTGVEKWLPPQAGWREQVYYHEELEVDESGLCAAEIRNPAFPLAGGAGAVALTLKWDAKAMPLCARWKQAGEGEHVLGIEPANCRVEGIEKERESGRLRLLAPGEGACYRIEFEIAEGV